MLHPLDSICCLQAIGRLLFKQPGLLPALLDGNGEAEARWAPAGCFVLQHCALCSALACPCWSRLPLFLLPNRCPVPCLPPSAPAGCWTGGCCWGVPATLPRCLCPPWARWAGAQRVAGCRDGALCSAAEHYQRQQPFGILCSCCSTPAAAACTLLKRGLCTAAAIHLCCLFLLQGAAPPGGSHHLQPAVCGCLPAAAHAGASRPGAGARCDCTACTLC